MFTDIYTRCRGPLERLSASALDASRYYALLDDYCIVLPGSDYSIIRKGGSHTPQSPGYLQGTKDCTSVPPNSRFHSLRLEASLKHTVAHLAR
jgi:hypothetical protein